jgi:hypothetical protein
MQDGSGQPDVGVPRLAGLTASYLLDQLNYFAAGTRQNTAMGPYARMLTRLIAAGRSPDEAVALVSDATTAHQRVLLASLCMAGVIASGLPRHAPTLIVVGPVLALREVLTPLQQAAPMTVAMMPEPSLGPPRETDAMAVLSSTARRSLGTSSINWTGCWAPRATAIAQRLRRRLPSGNRGERERC